MERVRAADVAWKLYREGPGRENEATELARGIVKDAFANPDEIASAGTLLFAAGHYADAARARTTAVQTGAAPALLAYLDTACELQSGDGRAARRALGRHLAASPDPLHPDMAWLAAQVGSPRLAYRASRRAGLGASTAARYVAEAIVTRSPRRACRAVCSR